MDFHQGNETSGDIAEIMGGQDNNIHRGHTHSGRDKGGSKSTHRSVAVSPGSSGVYYKSREVIPEPSSRTRIPWAVGGLVESPAQTPWPEDQADSQRCNTATDKGISVRSPAFTISGEAQCSISGNVSCSLILLSLAEGSSESSDRRKSRLWAFDDKAVQRLREELDWWQHHLTHWNGSTVIQKRAQIVWFSQMPP